MLVRYQSSGGIFIEDDNLSDPIILNRSEVDELREWLKTKYLDFLTAELYEQMADLKSKLAELESLRASN